MALFEVGEDDKRKREAVLALACNTTLGATGEVATSRVRRGRTRWPGLQMLVSSNRTNFCRDNTRLCYAVKLLDHLLSLDFSLQLIQDAIKRLESPRILTRLTRCSARCWVHSG